MDFCFKKHDVCKKSFWYFFYNENRDAWKRVLIFVFFFFVGKSDAWKRFWFFSLILWMKNMMHDFSKKDNIYIYIGFFGILKMKTFLLLLFLGKQKLSVNIFAQKGFLFCFENENISFFHLLEKTKWKHSLFPLYFLICTKKEKD